MKEVTFLVISIFILLFLAAFASYIFYSDIETNSIEKNIVIKKSRFWIIASLAFLIRVFFSFVYEGHQSDMSCFDAWSEHIFNDGFGKFYTSNMFTDYPPGYMYILYLIGFLKDFLNLGKPATYVILKMPAIICDILCGWVVYKTALKQNGQKSSLMFASFFLFNPAVIFNSSVWGQVDSVLTLFIILMLYLINEERMYLSYFTFALALFIKPQALFYAPILIYGIIEKVFLKNFSYKNFFKNLFAGILAILSLVVLAAPFGIRNVINQYISTLNSYNFVSVNAYNFWTAIGLNWHEPNILISLAGYLSIFITVILSAYIFFSKKYKNRYFLTSAFICFSTFMLSARMHERYAFPAIALMLCALAISKTKKDFLLFICISSLQFINMVHVLFYYNPETFYSSGFNNISILISWLSVVVLIFFWKHFVFFKMPRTTPKVCAPKFSGNRKITHIDLLLIFVITAIYSIIALYNLGDKVAPQNSENIESATIELTEEAHIFEVMFYLGANELSDEQTLDIEIRNSDNETTYRNALTSGAVFFWTSEETDVHGKYITLSSKESLSIMEFAIKDKENRLIIPEIYPSALFDEQDTVPEFQSYRNSTYFDEIYHARTAYELENSLDVYEWTHPPLGKTIIGLGIKLFGMTPFGWRIAGTLLGILMIPVIYIFSKNMFGLTWLSACTATVFSADFMHFTQTRIATIDVYVTFFIMLMYLFMYKYYITDASAPLKKMLVPLGLSALYMGFAIACKWTGVYAAIGLAVIFFISLFEKYNQTPDVFKDKIPKTIIFCVLVFVLLPVGIYILSYIPFIRSEGTGFMGVIQNQIDMFTYHGKTVLDAEHYFSSPWYQWPINYRPIWYYSGTNGVNSENISAFGNPLVWWSGIIAFLYLLYDAYKTRSKNAIFLVIAYLAQLIPWMGVTRITFIYHYFPCVPFVVLMIAYSFNRIYMQTKKGKSYFLIFTILSVILFIIFYPVISGFPVSEDFVRSFLKWLPSWQLI